MEDLALSIPGMERGFDFLARSIPVCFACGCPASESAGGVV